MKTITQSLLLGSVVLLASLPAAAGHGHGRIGDRLERQHQRIEQGIESGELTRREARKLYKQQRRIGNLARELRDDGRLTRKERRILQHRLDRASARIFALKHNNHQRGGYDYRYRHDWADGRGYRFWADDRPGRYRY